MFDYSGKAIEKKKQPEDRNAAVWCLWPGDNEKDAMVRLFQQDKQGMPWARVDARNSLALGEEPCVRAQMTQLRSDARVDRSRSPPSTTLVQCVRTRTSPFVEPPNRQCQLFVASGACKDEDESRRKDQLNKKTRRSPKIPDVGHTGVSFDETQLCGSTAFSLFLLPSTIKRLDLGCSSMCLAGALQKRCKNTAGTSDMALPGGTLPRIEPSTHHKSHWTG